MRKPKRSLGAGSKSKHPVKSQIAVLLIDMQVNFVECFWSSEIARLIANQIKVLRRCRKHMIPVIVTEYYNNGDTVEPLQRALKKMVNVYRIQKCDDDAFYNTSLDDLLQQIGARSLVLMGINADACVRRTAESAIYFGYKIITSDQVISGWHGGNTHRNTSWYQANGIWVKSVSALLPMKHA